MPPQSSTLRRPGIDALGLAILLFAVMQITGLAESAVLPTRLDDVLRHPVLGSILPPAGEQAMGQVSPRPGEPLGLLLNAVSLGLLLLYFLVDLAWHGPWQRRSKWFLLALLVVTALFLPTFKLMLLRAQSGPASYTHDGGVIQTEATIHFLLEGKNPYREDYLDTPMAEWGFSEYRTALYHYPYLPWTFLFSAPFYLIGQSAGWYDQRLVYLLLMAIALLLAPRLALSLRARLLLVATLALNPIMSLDIIFGQNDSFVFCWILFALVAWRTATDRPQHQQTRWLYWLSGLCFGLACASKPTAWFFAPFYGLLLLRGQILRRQATAAGRIEQSTDRFQRAIGDQTEVTSSWKFLAQSIPYILRHAWPAWSSFLLIVTPYILWDSYAFYDDIWRWSSGQGETGYQIWGWGASNFVLAFGLVPDRFAAWPFWIAEALVALPLLLWLVHRQLHHNTLSNACWHYGVFLFAFFYVSRFLNENYLGYILAFWAVGYLSGPPTRLAEENFADDRPA